MKTKTLNTRNGSPIDLTVIGFGTAPLGELFGTLDEKTCIATAEEAFAQGIRYFDTSPNYGYGLAEARLSSGLRGIPRNEFILSTKIGRVMDPAGEKPTPVPGEIVPLGGHPHAPRFDYSYDGAMRSIEQSLLRLGMDRLDIVMIHDCDVWTHGVDGAPLRFREAMDGAYVALDKLRSDKTIKAIGFGLNEAESCANFAKAGDFDVGMMAGRYSLLDQSGLDEFLPIAQAKTMGVMMAGVFNSGILATGAVSNAKYAYVDAKPEILDKVRRIDAICRDHGVTLRQAAIQFAGTHPATASIVLGAVKPHEVIDNVSDAEVSIPVALWAELKHAGVIDARAPIPV